MLPDEYGDTKYTPPTDATYRAAYNRGWNTSRRGFEGSALDRADDRKELDAWYDGYHDAASDRPKWHLWHCRLAGGCWEHTYSRQAMA